MAKAKKNPPPGHRRRKGGGVLLCAGPRREAVLASIQRSPATHAELCERFPGWSKPTLYLDLQVLQGRGLVIHEKHGASWHAVVEPATPNVPVESVDASDLQAPA